MLPTSRLSSFLFLNIYMGAGCEGVLIAWNWLHKHTNKGKEFFQQTVHAQMPQPWIYRKPTIIREEWHREAECEMVQHGWHTHSGILCLRKELANHGCEILPAASCSPRQTHSQGRTDSAPPAPHMDTKHQGLAEIMVNQAQSWAEWGD